MCRRYLREGTRVHGSGYKSTANQNVRPTKIFSQLVRIKSFSSNTVQDVRSALERFKSKGVDRVVVDLRGNVGGLLPGGIDAAGLFLDSGKVIA